jgi:glycosyltransferase involved in cell wall biosynthesis
LVELYGLTPEKISVVYNGFNHNIFNTEPTPADERRKLFGRLGIEKPYILHHGTIQPRKNLIRLISAYRRVAERHKDLDLVLVGNLGWEYDSIVKFAKSEHSSGRVLFTGPLPEKELGVVVKLAELIVMPSLYEGFCLPMIEGMACGVPTVASNTSCLPEVSGNVLRYFDPLSKDEMAHVMENSLANSDLRKELSVAGIKRRCSHFQ